MFIVNRGISEDSLKIQGEWVTMSEEQAERMFDSGEASDTRYVDGEGWQAFVVSK